LIIVLVYLTRINLECLVNNLVSSTKMAVATDHILDSSVIIEDYFSVVRNTAGKSEIQSQSLLSAPNLIILNGKGVLKPLKVSSKLN
jgi:hypothetical protein